MFSNRIILALILLIGGVVFASGQTSRFLILITPTAAPPLTGALLLEDGVSILLLEDGTSNLCLEGGC